MLFQKISLGGTNFRGIQIKRDRLYITQAINTAESAIKKSPNSHQFLFLARGRGLGTRLTHSQTQYLALLSHF